MKFASAPAIALFCFHLINVHPTTYILIYGVLYDTSIMATRRRTSLEAREVNALPMRGGKLPFTQEAYDDCELSYST